MDILEGGFRHFNSLLLLPASTLVLGKVDPILTTVLSALEALDTGPSARIIVAVHRGLWELEKFYVIMLKAITNMGSFEAEPLSVID